jgi:hypothetical protein
MQENMQNITTSKTFITPETGPLKISQKPNIIYIVVWVIRGNKMGLKKAAP